MALGFLVLPAAAAENAIRGIVSDASGTPIADVAIRLDGASHASAVSGRDGSFVFAGIGGGTYTLTLSKQGLTTKVLRDVIVPSQASAFLKITMVAAPALRLIGSVITRERLPFNSTPAALKVFPREAYRDQGQASLASVLNQTPGAVVALPSQQNQAQPLAPYDATVRGGLPWETATLIDGDAVSLPSTGAFNLAYFPSFLLQDVEIIKGFGNVQTLANALDGAVNLRTADPLAARKGMLEIEADSRGGQFSDLAYAGTATDNRLSYSLMLAADGNPGPVPGSSAAGAALQRAQLLKLKYQSSPSVTATVSFAGTQGALGVAVARGFRFPNGTFGSFANSSQAQETHRFGLTSFELQNTRGNNVFTAKAYAMQLQRTNSYDAFAFPEIGSGLNSQDGAWAVSLQDDRQIASANYQIQLSDIEGQSQAQFCASGSTCATLIPAGARGGQTMLRVSMSGTASKYVDVQLSAAVLELRDRYSSDGGNTYTSRWFAAPIFHAGAAFHASPSLTFRVAAGTGVSAVPEAVLNANNGYPLFQTPVGLPARLVTQSTSADSQPESAFGMDAGVEYRLHGDTTTLSVDVYDVHTHGTYFDHILPISTANYQWVNGPPMTHQGIELGLQQFKRAGLGYIAQFSLLRNYVNSPIGQGPGNMAVLPSQNLSGGSLLVPGANDIAQLRVPYAQGYGEISYHWPRGSRLSLGALYLGANNPYARPAFVQLNSNLELSLGNWSKLQISVQNLGNAYTDGLPLGLAGVGVPLQNGAFAPANAGVVGPRTIRFMFRQSIGGPILER